MRCTLFFMDIRQAFIYALIASMLIPVGRGLYRVVTTSAVYSQTGSSGHGEANLADVVSSISSRPRTQTPVTFSTRDISAIREHYAPQYRDLPSGPAKPYARTGKLPPGWRQKMTRMPVALERHLEPLPVGYERGVFEGHAVIFRPRGLFYDAIVLY